MMRRTDDFHAQEEDEENKSLHESFHNTAKKAFTDFLDVNFKISQEKPEEAKVIENSPEPEIYA